MVRIYSDPSGWSSFLKQGKRWEIFAPNRVIYAVYTEEDGIVKPVRPGRTGHLLGKPLGRVDNITEAVIVARATYRLTRKDT